MIGAMDLSEVARALEEAAKQEDSAYIDEHHEEMMTKYDRVLKAIGDEVKEPSGSAPEEDDIFEFEAAGDEPDGDEEGGAK